MPWGKRHQGPEPSPQIRAGQDSSYQHGDSSRGCRSDETLRGNQQGIQSGAGNQSDYAEEQGYSWLAAGRNDRSDNVQKPEKQHTERDDPQSRAACLISLAVYHSQDSAGTGRKQSRSQRHYHQRVAQGLRNVALRAGAVIRKSRLRDERKDNECD